MDNKAEPSSLENEANEEIDAIEKVINAMLYYERHAAFLFKRHLNCLKSMSVEDKRIIAPILQAHVKKALECKLYFRFFNLSIIILRCQSESRSI